MRVVRTNFKVSKGSAGLLDCEPVALPSGVEVLVRFVHNRNEASLRILVSLQAFDSQGKPQAPNSATNDGYFHCRAVLGHIRPA